MRCTALQCSSIISFVGSTYTYGKYCKIQCRCTIIATMRQQNRPRTDEKTLSHKFYPIIIIICCILLCVHSSFACCQGNNNSGSICRSKVFDSFPKSRSQSTQPDLLFLSMPIYGIAHIVVEFSAQTHNGHQTSPV